ncbi:MAG: hypothetical protein GEU83_08405 [Pseudonocardiaceae bacterium]|nr:hypothetical protein [Pseudonocardiaceae bacterium]
MPQAIGRRMIKRRAIGSAVAGAAILAAGCGSDQAGDPAASEGGGASQQAEDERATAQATDLLAAAERRLGEDYGGGYLSDSGQVIVLTTDPGTTGTLRELGAQPEVVQFSKATLSDWQEQVAAALGEQPPAAVTSWGVELRRNAVVVDVLAEKPVPAALQEILVDSAGAVVVDEAPGPVRPLPGG